MGNLGYCEEKTSNEMSEFIFLFSGQKRSHVIIDLYENGTDTSENNPLKFLFLKYVKRTHVRTI